MPDGINHRAFCSGDVLLSRGLSPYYHRGCSVSLPCSKWERVGPLRYYHQSAEPHWQFAAVTATQARSRISGDLRQSLYQNFERTGFSNRQSQIENLCQFPGIYIQEEECELNELRFFEIFHLSCLPFRENAERVNRKVKDQAERVISTPELNILLCLHPEPINVVVYHDPSGRSHLGIGLALRCFQRLSFPNIATQRCR